MNCVLNPLLFPVLLEMLSGLEIMVRISENTILFEEMYELQNNNTTAVLVHRLCKIVSETGRNITSDNYFTSVELSKRI